MFTVEHNFAAVKLYCELTLKTFVVWGCVYITHNKLTRICTQAKCKVKLVLFTCKQFIREQELSVVVMHRTILFCAF